MSYNLLLLFLLFMCSTIYTLILINNRHWGVSKTVSTSPLLRDDGKQRFYFIKGTFSNITYNIKVRDVLLLLVIYCPDKNIISAQLIITITEPCVISNDQIRSKNVFS